MVERLDDVRDRTYICHPQFKKGYFLDQKAIFTTGFTIGNSYVQDRIKLAKEREEEKMMMESEILWCIYHLQKILEKEKINVTYIHDDDSYNIRYRKTLYGGNPHTIVNVVNAYEILDLYHRTTDTCMSDLIKFTNDYFERMASNVVEEFRKKDLELRSHDYLRNVGTITTMQDYLRYVEDELKKENIEFEWRRDGLNNERYRFECRKRVGCRGYGCVRYIDEYLTMRSPRGMRAHADAIVELIINDINKEEKKEMHSIMDASNVKVTIGNRVYTPSSVQINCEPQLIGSPETIYTIEVNTTRNRCERATPTTDYSSLHNKRRIPEIKKVIFNDPATIVMWADNTKTIVKCENESFDPEKGLAMAIAKKALGNQGNYFETIKKHKKDYVPKKRGLDLSISNKPVEFEAVIENFDYEQFKRMGLLGTTKNGAKIYINQKPDNEDYKLEPNGDDE